MHDLSVFCQCTLASFPGPSQLSIACGTESARGEPGNKAKVALVPTSEPVFLTIHYFALCLASLDNFSPMLQNAWV